ncbi:hypothetical protein MMC28_011460 [Mycoblastus sanguinarius]|nr:hypothetical protein [Mycoblastus sanguinarius]
MLLQVSLLSLLGAAAAVPAMNLSNRQAAGPGITILNISSQICGTAPPDETLRQAHANLRAKQGMQTRASSSPIVVQTYMHLVTTSDQAHNYPFNIRNILFSQQSTVLNISYRPANISFRLAGSSYTIRNDWATDANSTLMKQTLRQGGYSALNIYFQTNLSSAPYTYNAASTLLGYCTLPTTITYGNPPTEYPTIDYATDGCNVLAGSMTGSPTPVYGYSLGKTAVHEVGHWFGMLHTFQDNTCTSGDPGDYIDDTPQEGVSTVGCPTGKDSCPQDAGLDPISNYMDYSTDAW